MLVEWTYIILKRYGASALYGFSASSGTPLTCPPWCATAASARSRLVGE